MTTISKTVKHSATRELHKRGTSVASWARLNGFKPNSVSQIIQGQSKFKGTKGGVGQKIREALIRDRLMKEKVTNTRKDRK